jgi:hypothetical protein
MTRRTLLKHLKIFWVGLLALVLGAGSLILPKAARAQGEDVPELSRDWNVRIGVYIFNGNAASNKGGRFGISGLVERTVYRGDTYDVNVGIGYNGFDRIYSVPATLSLIYHPTNLRLGAGVGYAFNKRVDGRGSNGSVFDLLVGYQVSRGKNPSSVDLRYFFVGGSNNELDGYSLTYGIRF